MNSQERAILNAAQRCCERFGIAKLTVDDVAAEAGVSRATLYRVFPGGKDVLLEALRVQELEEFFVRLRGHLDGTTDLRDLVIRTVVHATRELRDDLHLAVMMASESGDVLNELTVDGVPRILRVASLFLTPLLDPYLDRPAAARLVDLTARLVISYFLAPSEFVDLADEHQAARFIDDHVLPAFNACLTPLEGAQL